MTSYQGGMGHIELRRTDEETKDHFWRLWHMNQTYGMNSLQVWEYRNDSNGNSCTGNPDDGAICNPRLTIEQGGNVCIGCGSASGGNLEVAHSLQVHGELNMNGNSIVNCGALTEANLQTPEEITAGGSDRFEEGDVLCWSAKAQRLERCVTPGDPLVQAVADSGGRPIVIGAEAVKVVGPVHHGDYLVASIFTGYTMTSPTPSFGSVIAQALEDFSGERGIIKAMIRKM